MAEHIFAVKTIGGSMRPLINGGDFLFFEKTEYLKPGDVVYYELSGQKFVHRVKSISGNTAVINDDSGIISEQSISINNILGKRIGGINGFLGLVLNKIINVITKPLRRTKQSLFKAGIATLLSAARNDSIK